MLRNSTLVLTAEDPRLRVQTTAIEPTQDFFGWIPDLGGWSWSVGFDYTKDFFCRLWIFFWILGIIVDEFITKLFPLRLLSCNKALDSYSCSSANFSAKFLGLVRVHSRPIAKKVHKRWPPRLRHFLFDFNWQFCSCSEWLEEIGDLRLLSAKSLYKFFGLVWCCSSRPFILFLLLLFCLLHLSPVLAHSRLSLLCLVRSPYYLWFP